MSKRTGQGVHPRERTMSGTSSSSPRRMMTGQDVHPREEAMSGRSCSSPRRSPFSFTASREERLKIVHQVPVTSASMSNNEDRLSRWKSSTNRQLRIRDRRPGSLRSAGAHVPSHLAEFQSSQFLQGPLPLSALDRMCSFRTGRRECGDDEREALGMIYSVNKLAKSQGEEEGSSSACDPALDLANGSIQSLRTEGEFNKRSRGAWELACALAYAYLHQQQPLGLHEVAYSPPVMCSHEGEDHCRVLKLKNRKQDVIPPDFLDAVCHMTEVVNPTQAAEWFGDRAALVS